MTNRSSPDISAEEAGFLEDNIATVAYHLGRPGARMSVGYDGGSKLLVDPGEVLKEISRRLSAAQNSGRSWDMRLADRVQQLACDIMGMRDAIRAALDGAATPTPAFDAMIANLVELDKQRTPGPWRKSHEAIGAPGRHPNGPTNLPLVAECDTDFGMYKTLGPLQAGKNARFIVALENAWPKILATLVSRPERAPE